VTDEEIYKRLKFEKLISFREFENDQWVVVAREKDTGDDNYYTQSVLVEINNESDYEAVTSTYDWETGIEFGLPTEWTTYSGDTKETIFDIEGIRNTRTRKQLKFNPFILWRDFNGISPQKFEVVHNFFLYHNLYFDKEENVYKKIDGIGNEHKVMYIKNEEKDKEVKIATRFLKDYLTDRKMALVRQHDCRRHSNISLKAAMKSKEQEFSNIEKGVYNYNVCVVSDNSLSMMNIETYSRLLGKDIIQPYKGKKQIEHKYCTFKIGVDENGNEIEQSCQYPKEYLTPVFFTKEVFKKYMDNPKRYKVDFTLHTFGCLNLWGERFDINNTGLVNIYLGDLAHLPYEEQMYWKTFNVLPDGGISEARFKADFEGKFSDSKDPIHCFKQAFKTLQQRFKNNFGVPLFLDLKTGDQYCYSSLHVPFTAEPKEFDEQLLCLAKLLNDSINKKKLDEINNVQKEKTMESLGLFLSTKLGQEVATERMFPFRILQEFRSAGAAHRKGDNFDKLIRKYEMAEISNPNKFICILTELTNSLTNFLE
jgi:hypothetical protein